MFLTGLYLVSCLQPKKDSAKKVLSSIAQRQIQYLVDSFKLTVGSDMGPNKQDSIRIKYDHKFYELLSNIYIDSIRVHVDSVIIDNLTVTTAFHCNNEISFRSSVTFLQKMDSKQDSLFKFMKGLKPGLDTMINFAYMGNHEVRLPNSNGRSIIKIFAFPIPIWSKKE